MRHFEGSRSGGGGRNGRGNGHGDVERALRELPCPCRMLLTTGAVIGERFPLDVVARVLEEADAAELAWLAAMAVEAGVVVFEGVGWLRFRDAALREAVYATLSPERCEALVRRVAVARQQAASAATAHSTANRSPT